jgi:hypothetical protein
MPEYWNARKKLAGIGISLRSQLVSPASVFRHPGQSATAGHGLVRHCPAMESSNSDMYLYLIISCNINLAVTLNPQ